jgi:hypothetical protein
MRDQPTRMTRSGVVISASASWEPSSSQLRNARDVIAQLADSGPDPAFGDKGTHNGSPASSIDSTPKQDLAASAPNNNTKKDAKPAYVHWLYKGI